MFRKGKIDLARGFVELSLNHGCTFKDFFTLFEPNHLIAIWGDFPIHGPHDTYLVVLFVLCFDLVHYKVSQGLAKLCKGLGGF